MGKFIDSILDMAMSVTMIVLSGALYGLIVYSTSTM